MKKPTSQLRDDDKVMDFLKFFDIFPSDPGFFLLGPSFHEILDLMDKEATEVLAGFRITRPNFASRDLKYKRGLNKPIRKMHRLQSMVPHVHHCWVLLGHIEQCRKQLASGENIAALRSAILIGATAEAACRGPESSLASAFERILDGEKRARRRKPAANASRGNSTGTS